MDHARRRRPTIAAEWQLDVLKKLQSESSSPTEEQRMAAAAETGLDEKWVRNWFTRQRSRLVSCNRKATTRHPATVPTFKLQLCYPPEAPSPPQETPSRRSVSRVPTNRLPRPSRSTVDVQASSPQSVSHLNENPTLVPHITTMPTYSRDPLCNRYPDFSQFFRPQVHERFRSSGLSVPINDHDHLIQLPANSNMVLHAPTHFQALLNSSNPLHFGNPPTFQGSSTCLRSFPIAFSMKLVDLFGHL